MLRAAAASARQAGGEALRSLSDKARATVGDSAASRCTRASAMTMAVPTRRCSAWFCTPLRVAVTISRSKMSAGVSHSPLAWAWISSRFSLSGTSRLERVSCAATSEAASGSKIGPPAVRKISICS